MECLEDELFRSKCSGVNTTSTIRKSFLFLFEHGSDRLVVILGPLKGGLKQRVTEIVM